MAAVTVATKERVEPATRVRAFGVRGVPAGASRVTSLVSWTLKMPSGADKVTAKVKRRPSPAAEGRSQSSTATT